MSLLKLGPERPRGGMEAAGLKAHHQLQSQTTEAKGREAQRLTCPSRLLARAVASIKSRQPFSPAGSAAWWGVSPAARGRPLGKSASQSWRRTTLKVVTKAMLEASAETQAALVCPVSTSLSCIRSTTHRKARGHGAKGRRNSPTRLSLFLL